MESNLVRNGVEPSGQKHLLRSTPRLLLLVEGIVDTVVLSCKRKVVGSTPTTGSSSSGIAEVAFQRLPGDFGHRAPLGCGALFGPAADLFGHSEGHPWGVLA